MNRALWSIGKAMITDSGFCVLRGILETRKRGIYGSVLIKKRHFWPRGVHGDGTNEYFSIKNINDVGCISGDWTETEFIFFFMQETDYNIMLVSTLSGLTVPEVQKEEILMMNGEVVKFKYIATIAYHYRYREAVDNPNSLSHDGGTNSQIDLDIAWQTT